MTGILASVRDPREAALLLRTSIDILDLKDPGRGALGSVDPAVVRQVIQLTAGQRQISAAAGSAEDADILDHAARLSREGVDYVKIGFSHTAQQSLLPRFAMALEPPARAIAVLFADSADMDPMRWVQPAHDGGLAGLMLDTSDKRSGSLGQHTSLAQVKEWVAATRQAGLLCGLAGQLDAESACALLCARPDYLGFRGALCNRAVRTGPICPDAVRKLLATLEGAGAVRAEDDDALLAGDVSTCCEAS